eukprot:scaffold35185_cov62-Phaeocystis_antarctica.AAC.2
MMRYSSLRSSSLFPPCFATSPARSSARSSMRCLFFARTGEGVAERGYVADIGVDPDRCSPLKLLGPPGRARGQQVQCVLVQASVLGSCSFLLIRRTVWPLLPGHARLIDARIFDTLLDLVEALRCRGPEETDLVVVPVSV